jgi:hypothetical protein
MSKFNEALDNQLKNPTSALNNLLNGKPVATADFSMETGTIIKLSASLLVGGMLLVAFNHALKKYA